MYFVSVRLREEWAAEIVTRPACKQQHVQTQGLNDVVTCAEQRLFFWWISCICIQHCLFFLLSTCVSLLTPSTSHQEALESLQEAMRELEAQPQTNMSYDEVQESYSQLMVRGVHNMYCKTCIYNAKTQVIKALFYLLTLMCVADHSLFFLLLMVGYNRGSLFLCAYPCGCGCLCYASTSLAPFTYALWTGL